MIISISFTSSAGQENLGTHGPPDSNKSESQPAIEDQAYLLLDQVIAGIGSLKLPENRSRLEVMAADLLWKRDSERARSLFLQAAGDVVELAQQSAGKSNEPFSRYQSSAELRQKLILTAAHHDAVLAYELFRKTQPKKDELAEAGRAENESYIEQLLLAEVSRIDPKFALSKAEEMLDRRSYSLAPGQNASSPKLDQQNARDLLVNLRPLLPQIEQHLPERYQALVKR